MTQAKPGAGLRVSFEAQNAGIQGGIVCGAAVLERVIAKRAGTAFGDHIAQRQRAPIQVTCNRVFRDFQHIDDGFDFLNLFRTALGCRFAHTLTVVDPRVQLCRRHGVVGRQRSTTKKNPPCCHGGFFDFENSAGLSQPGLRKRESYRCRNRKKPCWPRQLHHPKQQLHHRRF